MYDIQGCLKYASGCIDWFPNVLQFPALNSVAVGNQILENVLLAFKMSGNCHFQIKWLDNPEYHTCDRVIPVNPPPLRGSLPGKSPTATLFNAGNCSTLGNQSIHPLAYFYK
jgi:hypothetical protein